MFWGQTTKRRLDNLLKKFSNKYSYLEMYIQMISGQGKVGEYLNNETRQFTKKTESNEIAHAIILADFYFIGSNPQICFNMKRGFKVKQIDTIEELIANLDHDTEIDCLIKDKTNKFKFQQKRYPEEYKPWSVTKVIEYLDTEILPVQKYNNDSNHDLIIAINIQPKTDTQVNINRDFKEIYQHLTTKDIKLLQIAFLFNLNIKFEVWHEVFPRLGHYKIPWGDLSQHHAKRKTRLNSEINIDRL